MAKYKNNFDKTKIPQNQPLSKEQVQNNAGGYVFKIDKWSQLDRFLILGSTGSTYYCTERKMQLENADIVKACVKENGIRVVDRICEISDGGYATKNSPALFALAICASADEDATRRYALSKLSEVARIGTHLFEFLEYVQLFRDWGRGLRTAVANWYKRQCDTVAYQVIKYRNREGWTHRDALRLAHPKPEVDIQSDLFKWICTEEATERLLNDVPFIEGFIKIQQAKTASEAAGLITEYNLPRETVPTQFLKEREVWKALLVNMPLGAMVRNLGNMGSCGLLVPGQYETIEYVVNRLTNEDLIHRSRLHPLNILIAAATYNNGQGIRGSNRWAVVPQVSAALEDAFYKAFANVEPTNKRYYVGLDVSGSMSVAFNDIPNLSVREAATALAMCVVRTEPKCYVKGFTERMIDLPINKNTALSDAINKTSNLPFGRTDCALPMVDALNNGMECEIFIVMTDNETWAGNIHPVQALKEYRRRTGINAKLLVVAMTSTGFSIADPSDPGMMDFVGFDASLSQAISEFALL